MYVTQRSGQITIEATMSRPSRPIRTILSVFAVAIIAASRPSAVTAQILATPNAGTASVGPRLPAQYVPRRTTLPGERSDLRTTRAASGTTIHLSTLAIVVGIVVLLILLL
jgi:hypothetical protein